MTLISRWQFERRLYLNPHPDSVHLPSSRTDREVCCERNIRQPEHIGSRSRRIPKGRFPNQRKGLYAEQTQYHGLQTVAPSRPPKSDCRRSIQTPKSTRLIYRQSRDRTGIGWKQSDSRQSDDGGLSAPSNHTIIGPSLVNGRFL